MKERIGVYAGSFDPITLGHLDVIRRASLLFDRIIVGVGESRGKAPMFTVAERVAMIAEACKDLANVKAEAFKGLAVEFARARGALALVRGIRSSADYPGEMQMAAMNRALAAGIETVFLPTSPTLAHVSSSLAKEIAHHGGDTLLLVPPSVATRMAEKRQV